MVSVSGRPASDLSAPPAYPYGYPPPSTPGFAPTWVVPFQPVVAPPKPLEVQTRSGVERIRRAINYYRAFLAALLVLTAVGGAGASLTHVPSYFGVTPSGLPLYCAFNGTVPVPGTSPAPVGLIGLTALASVSALAVVIFLPVALARWRPAVREVRGAASEYGPEHLYAVRRAEEMVEYAIWGFVILFIFVVVYGLAAGATLSTQLGTSCGSSSSLATLVAPYTYLVAAGAAIVAAMMLVIHYFLATSLRDSISSISPPETRARLSSAATLLMVTPLLLVLGGLSAVRPGLEGLGALGYAAMIWALTLIMRSYDHWLAQPTPLPRGGVASATPSAPS